MLKVYDTIQAVSSYLRGLLCTQALLTGYGVGSAEASATSATLQWIIKDGTGMFGGMLFAVRATRALAASHVTFMSSGSNRLNLGTKSSAGVCLPIASTISR